MQKIKVSTRSALGKALVEGSYEPSVFLSLKTAEGKCLFRGVMERWEASGDDLTIFLDDWDSHWGEMMARKYWV